MLGSGVVHYWCRCQACTSCSRFGPYCNLPSNTGRVKWTSTADDYLNAITLHSWWKVSGLHLNVAITDLDSTLLFIYIFLISGGNLPSSWPANLPPSSHFDFFPRVMDTDASFFISLDYVLGAGFIGLIVSTMWVLAQASTLLHKTHLFSQNLWDYLLANLLVLHEIQRKWSMANEGDSCPYMVSYHCRLRTFVVWVVSRVLDSFQLVLFTMMIYHYSVTHWGDVVVLLRNTWYLYSRDFFEILGLNNFQELVY